ncbi:vesicle transport protein SEC20-like [Dermacentor silvarum]|uniref:vesicle transport protein SEC20-like n=1 Tax=Dermacentor silvarum TaxID=543639 RepID=UPI00189ACDB7|nr:vesicle transport protein SEC20-like [Dermacentor silvarum]
MASLWKSNIKNTSNSANAERNLLQEILKLDLRVKSCIQDIQNGCTSREDLNAKNLEAAESMRSYKKTLEALKALAMEQDKVQDKERLILKAEECVKGMKCNIEALRKANLVAEKNIHDQDRERLLSGGHVRQRGRADKETLMRSTSGMTENLFSISRMMADQVKHSENALDLLVGTSSVITESQEESRQMGSAILQSKKLLTKYGRREMTDRVLIFLALLFFFACVLFVLKRRLF